MPLYHHHHGRGLHELRHPDRYQTSLMALGPGGYRFTDYMRLGIALTVMGGY
jgi:hypothetical protein